MFISFHALRFYKPNGVVGDCVNFPQVPAVP